MNDSVLFEMSGISSGYGKKTVIREVNLTVRRGAVVTLLGSNGVGKSTTLRTAAGLLKPQKGRLEYNGRDVTRLGAFQMAGLGVGYSPEGRRVFGNLTVLENLAVGAYRLKTRREFQKNLDWVYELFPRLRERRRQLSESLSGGEQQMLAIGRALIAKPDLLLLDEPSLGLAPLVVRLIAETLTEINRLGVSILLVEQNARLALDISHQGYVMDKGEIVRQGASDELRDDKSIADIYLGFDDASQPGRESSA
ncbi:MAG: ABC transporter ATP-binding protein [Pseudomonadota bacterium]